MKPNQNSELSQLSADLKKEAEKEGFNPIGIARIPGSPRLELRTAALQRWINAGYHGEMQWMNSAKREKVDLLLEGAQSLLAVGLNYFVNQQTEPDSLKIARYAWGKDYHKVIEKRLRRLGHWLTQKKPNCKWRVCVDSTPLLDKAWAEEAGIGWIGKNSNLINPKSGSWMVIGHLLCTEPLVPDKPSKSLCGQCKKCIEACPTKAITEPFVVDSRSCLAYHTIENRNKKLPARIEESIGSWIAGCDICQEVCPWNTKSKIFTNDPDMIPQNWILRLTKAEALKWNDETWKEKLRGSALKRIKPWMWRRNANAIKVNSLNTEIKQ